jgi:hypothetical protein
MTGTTTKIAARLQAEAYDDELLELTDRLVCAAQEQCNRRLDLLVSTKTLLSRPQQEQLVRLVEARRISE